MSEHIDWNLLAKHLFGEYSKEEEAEIQIWIEEDSARRTLLRELRQVWETTGRPPTPRESTQWNVDALWEGVQRRVRQEVRPKPIRAREERRPVQRPAARKTPEPRRSRPSRRSAQPLLRLVAVIAVAAVTALLVVQLHGGPWLGAAAPEVKVFATQEGERARLRLADGTRVHLNVDSKLTLSPDFGTDVREVRLQGEAYFDVAPDSSRPFLVRAGGAAIRVLGTEFDINAYSERRVRVVVAEGRVVLQSEQASAREDVVLGARQVGELLESGEHLVRGGVDLSRYLAWMDGELVFENASFSEVVQTLERWYDIHVEPPRSQAVLGHLNARFSKDQPLREVLRAIATVFDLSYERHGAVVTFSPAKPS